VVTVAVLSDRDVEVELGIALVRLRLAQIPNRAGAAHHHARESPAPGVRELDHANADVSLLEYAVVREQALDVVADLEEWIAERDDVVEELRRQVLVHAADAEVVGMHARPGGALVEGHELFALLEAPQRRRECADVERLRRHIEQVRQQATDLAIEHADQLPAPGYRDAEELLRRQAERMLLVHRRDVVEPIEIGQRLQVGLVLDELLSPAMEKPDMRIGAGDDLAVEFEDEAQHAVRSRMLRAEIDDEIAESFAHTGLVPSRNGKRGPDRASSARSGRIESRLYDSVRSRGNTPDSRSEPR